ncbi:hypothetical protein BB558_003801 [Smittium angustum]|uniref:F5/8 type C domain-containing protein n=1 Tax=Smittium angustum TaxID=133377 RepID=A0A2U1J564_SMIAN|nr:hypothetical protein BB558_003801 [Smittium angustum]
MEEMCSREKFQDVSLEKGAIDILEYAYGAPFLNHKNFRVVGEKINQIESTNANLKSRNSLLLLLKHSKEIQNITSDSEESYEIEDENNTTDTQYHNSETPTTAVEPQNISDKLGSLFNNPGKQPIHKPIRKPSRLNYSSGISTISTNDQNQLLAKRFKRAKVNLETSIPYEIYAWSNFSANYFPHNIISYNPNEQESRWSSSSNNHRQFITLRLEKPAFVRAIKFGKYHKPHVCNLKEFKVYSGMTPDNMIEILHSGIRNDDKSEIITTRQSIDNHLIPSRYIKIQPLEAYDQKFNFSIWHVELLGTIDPSITNKIINEYNLYLSSLVVKNSLKFFRKAQLSSSFEALKNETGVTLECTILENIYNSLNTENSYKSVEELLVKAHSQGILSSEKLNLPYESFWEPLSVGGMNLPRPKGRGGHRLCIDDKRRKLYLFGGWDGICNLADLWEYDLVLNKWVWLFSDTSKVGGPGQRSLHSMCFDSVKNRLYIIGKFIDEDFRASGIFDSDMYYYDLNKNRWHLVSSDTYSEGGPRLMYDSQMVFDPISQKIYLYGGKVTASSMSDTGVVFGGLYCYDTITNTWTVLRKDSVIQDCEFQLQGRLFHSMAIDPEAQRLFILSGFKDGDTLGDFLVYDINSRTFFEKTKDLLLKSPPSVKSSCRPKGYYGSSIPEGYTGTFDENTFIRSDSFKVPESTDSPHVEDIIYRWYSKNGYYITQDVCLASESIRSQYQAQASGNVARFSNNQSTEKNLNQNIKSIGITFDTRTKEIHAITGHFITNTLKTQPASTIGLEKIANEVESFSKSNLSFNTSLFYTGDNQAQMQNLKRAMSTHSEKNSMYSKPTTENIALSVLTYQLATDEWQENYHSSYENPSQKQPFKCTNNASDSLFSTKTSTRKQSSQNLNKDVAYNYYNESVNSSNSLKRDVQSISQNQPDQLFFRPKPRFAMSVVYSEQLSTHFMFGGNPLPEETLSRSSISSTLAENGQYDNQLRLDDLWALKLKRPDSSTLLRETMYLVRESMFKEMCFNLHSQNSEYTTEKLKDAHKSNRNVANQNQDINQNSETSKYRDISIPETPKTRILNSKNHETSANKTMVCTCNNNKRMSSSDSIKGNQLLRHSPVARVESTYTSGDSGSDPSSSICQSIKMQKPRKELVRMVSPGPFSEPKNVSKEIEVSSSGPTINKYQRIRRNTKETETVGRKDSIRCKICNKLIASTDLKPETEKNSKISNEQTKSQSNVDNEDALSTKKVTTMECLEYLKSQVSVLVNFNNEFEAKRYKALSKYLFDFNGENFIAGINFHEYFKENKQDTQSGGYFEQKLETGNMDINTNSKGSRNDFAETGIFGLDRVKSGRKAIRNELFENLCKFFPESKRQPETNIEESIMN